MKSNHFEKTDCEGKEYEKEIETIDYSLNHLLEFRPLVRKGYKLEGKVKRETEGLREDEIGTGSAFQ